MTLLPLFKACRGAMLGFPDRHQQLRDSVAEHYRAHHLQPNDRLEIECALFIYWSVEIGLHNVHTWWLDRYLAQSRFAGLVRQGIEHPLAREIAVGPGMDEFYRRRSRDVLRTVRNVHVSWDASGRLAVPLTERTTRLFVAYTTEPRGTVPPEAQRALHLLMVEQCRAHVVAIMAGLAQSEGAPRRR